MEHAATPHGNQRTPTWHRSLLSPAVHDREGRPGHVDDATVAPRRMPIVRLKPGHVQPVWAGHPWIYAQAIHRIEGEATAGDEVSVVDPRGNLLGRGFYSPSSAIPVRILVRDAKTPLDGAFFRAKLERATAKLRDGGL